MSPDAELRRLNLNLLPVLNALLRTRSVSRTAASLELAQSSVSASLKRLREAFGDELLAQGPSGTTLTPRARALQVPLASLMEQLRRDVLQTSFDEATSRRAFRIASTDYVAAVLGPYVAQALADRAPGLTVQFLEVRPSCVDDLDAGEVDVVLGPRHDLNALLQRAPTPHPIERTLLWTDDLVGVARREGPPPPETLDDYLAAPHVTFSLSTTWSGNSEAALLGERANEKRDRVFVPSIMAIPWLVLRSGCLGTVPESMWKLFCDTTTEGLTKFPLPFEVPPLRFELLWLARFSATPGHAWFRELILTAIRDSDLLDS
ncbi:MAG: LysR family transcriptional regulator [Myxococcota bacterium]